MPRRRITIETEDKPSKELKICRACNGRGYKDFAGLFICDVCKGTGYVRV